MGLAQPLKPRNEPNMKGKRNREQKVEKTLRTEQPEHRNPGLVRHLKGAARNQGFLEKKNQFTFTGSHRAEETENVTAENTLVI